MNPQLAKAPLNEVHISKNKISTCVFSVREKKCTEKIQNSGNKMSISLPKMPSLIMNIFKMGGAPFSPPCGRETCPFSSPENVVLAPNNKINNCKVESMNANNLNCSSDQVSLEIIEQCNILSEEKNKNRILNINNSILLSLEWTENLSRLSQRRYNHISKTTMYLKLQRFIHEVSNLDSSISQNIVIYSGSALTVHGITYTKDIDIIVFGMSSYQIKTEILSKLSKSVLNDINLDICIYDKSEDAFIKFKNSNKKEQVLHHNNQTLKHLLQNCPVTNYSGFNSELLKTYNINRDNVILKNSLMIGGIYVFSIELLEKFYLYRYETTNVGERHYVILDMYLMHTYANSKQFEVSTYPNMGEMDKFNSHVLKYENINLDKRGEIINILHQILRLKK